jgi:aminoglycoside N3'-acetyltransferase
MCLLGKINAIFTKCNNEILTIPVIGLIDQNIEIKPLSWSMSRKDSYRSTWAARRTAQIGAIPERRTPRFVESTRDRFAD